MTEKEPKRIYVKKSDLHGPIAETIVDNLPDGLPPELRQAAVELLIVTGGMLEVMGAKKDRDTALEIAEKIQEDIPSDKI